MKKKQKFYVVWKGRDTGVFYSWDDCYAAVDKFQGALYKSYESEEEAFEALKNVPNTNSQNKRHHQIQKTTKPTTPQNTQYIANSIAVDAACSGNPGDMEYRGVAVNTRQVIFHMGPFPDGTNNIGEFLAIVHGLALMAKKNITLPLYSDSKTAIIWVQHKKCNTKLERTARNAELFNLIERAEKWLLTHTYTTPIYKWQTEKWGEIPADFGRK